MKSYTTEEQSRKLLSLGIDTNLADMCFVIIDGDDYQEAYYSKMPYSKVEKNRASDLFDGVHGYRKEILPVFKFKTLLSMMPCQITGEDGRKYTKMSDGTSIRYSIVKTDHDGVPFEETYQSFNYSRSKYVNIFDMACYLLEKGLLK